MALRARDEVDAVTIARGLAEGVPRSAPMRAM
jgi:hypothetical protein